MQITVGQSVFFEVDFGQGNSGFAHVGYALKNGDGSITPAPAAPRTENGVVEVGDGVYGVQLQFSQEWNGSIEWDSGGALFNDTVTEPVVVISDPNVVQPFSIQAISFKNVGAPNTPQEIKRARRSRMDMFRKNGQPVIHMHMWNGDDVDSGQAKACPACWDSTYSQVRNDCQVCYSIGWVSVENSTDDTWVDDRGRIVTGDPGTGVRAPRYGGFGPRTLTWAIEPDKALDLFKLDTYGALVKVQNAQAFAPWYPDMNDNDLLINVWLDKNLAVVQENERFQLRMSNPMSIRGWGGRQKGMRENEYLVAQSFEMTLIPKNTILRQVPIYVP